MDFKIVNKLQIRGQLYVSTVLYSPYQLQMIILYSQSFFPWASNWLKCNSSGLFRSSAVQK
jgi:hypothetical protein